MFVLGQEDKNEAREVKAAEDDSVWFKGEEKYLKYWTHCKYISEAHYVRISENFAIGVQIQSFDDFFFLFVFPKETSPSNDSPTLNGRGSISDFLKKTTTWRFSRGAERGRGQDPIFPFWVRT